jgi:hypothetical protein
MFTMFGSLELCSACTLPECMGRADMEMFSFKFFSNFVDEQE